MDTIKLRNGKVFESDFISFVNGNRTIFVWVQNSDLPEVVSNFGNADNLQEIIINELVPIYGYVKLSNIVIEDNAIRLTLDKED